MSSSRRERKYTQIIDYIEDQIGADINRDLMEVAVAAVDIASIDQNIEAIGGQAQSAIDVADKIDQIEDALTSVGSDQLRVDLQNNNAGTLPTEQQTPIGIEDSTGTQVDPLDTGDQPLDASGAEIDVDLNSQTLSPITVTDDGNLAITAYNGGTLPTEQQTPIQVEDSTGTNIDPLARQDTAPITGSTTANATNVTLALGDYRKSVDWFVDVSGAATLTVEVRTSGGTWREFDTVTYSAATAEVEQYESAFAEIRASVDTALNTLEGSSKGV